MFEKIKPLVDKMLGLPGTQEEREVAWLGISLLFILGCRAEEVDEIKKLHVYLWNSGVRLPCFAPENNN